MNNFAGPAYQRSLLLLWTFSAWNVDSALGIIAVGDGESYMTSYLSRKLLMTWSFIPYIFERLCALQTLVHSFVDLPRYLIPSLATGGLTRCTSVVIFKLLQHRPSTLVGLQYGRSAIISVSRFVNIPVAAFGRGLPIILSSCAFHSRKSGNHLLVVVSTVSRCHSVTVSRDAVR